jgi:hypothetical protein
LKGCVVKHSKHCDKWSNEEVDSMVSAKSNVVMNKLYERYIPSWLASDRITSESSALEKETWVSAKYNDNAFVFPNDVFFSDRVAEEVSIC